MIKLKEIYGIYWIIVFTMLSLLAILVHSFEAGQAEKKDYCNGEVFAADCGVHEVVVMETALYGRMEIGRCVKTNLGYLGCNTDVLRVMDKKCSGLSKCEFPVTSKEITVHVPCLDDLKTYLQASYSCIQALRVNTCQSHYMVHISDRSVSLGSRQLFEPADCSQELSHWTLEAQSGQRINMSLIDFNWDQNTGTSSVCQTEYFTKITDSVNHKTTTLCSNGEKYRHLGLSARSSVTLQIPKKAFDAQRHNFIISFHATGCPDLVTPRNAWLKREGVHVTVGCLSNKHTWHLTCTGTRWQGVIGNCTQGVLNQQQVLDRDGSHSYVQEVAVLVICTVTIVICSVIIVVGVICYKRIRSKEPRYLPASSRDGSKSQATYSSYRYDISLSSEPDTISMSSSPYRHHCVYVDPTHAAHAHRVNTPQLPRALEALLPPQTSAHHTGSNPAPHTP